MVLDWNASAGHKVTWFEGIERAQEGLDLVQKHYALLEAYEEKGSLVLGGRGLDRSLRMDAHLALVQNAKGSSYVVWKTLGVGTAEH